jgi:hypothetical protein
MNLQIQQLIDTVGTDVSGKWMAVDKVEKFAELIVEECIRELEISRKCDPYTGDLFNCEYNTCINEQTIVLKEHFGVEQ